MRLNYAKGFNESFKYITSIFADVPMSAFRWHEIQNTTKIDEKYEGKAVKAR